MTQNTDYFILFCICILTNFWFQFLGFWNLRNEKLQTCACYLGMSLVRETLTNFLNIQFVTKTLFGKFEELKDTAHKHLLALVTHLVYNSINPKQIKERMNRTSFSGCLEFSDDSPLGSFMLCRFVIREIHRTAYRLQQAEQLSYTYIC